MVNPSTLLNRCPTNVNLTVDAFEVVGRALAGIVERHQSPSKISLSPGRAPRPTVPADVARIEEIIQINKLLSEVMKVRSDPFAKLGQPRISVSPVEVPQDLVVSSIFFYNVDYMFDSLSQRCHHKL